MSQHNGNREAALSRRHALAWITATGTTALYVLSAAAGKRFSPFDRAEAAAIAHDKPVILVIVKDTTSFYWQTVIAGARKAGQDLGIKIVELGAQSDSDASGQVSILEIAVASNPTVARARPRAVRRTQEAGRRSCKESQDHWDRFRRRFRGLHLDGGDGRRAGGPYRC
jgi:hypothetical protein